MSLLHSRANADPVIVDPVGRPRAVVISDEHVAVTAIESVREEVAAYHPEVGPRTLFVVRAGVARLRLVHHHRDHRWRVEVLGPAPASLRPAA